MTDNVVILYLNKKSLKKQMKISKLTFRFFQLAMNQMITFNTSLDSEKKTLPDQA
jgi:hypothetical protein